MPEILHLKNALEYYYERSLRARETEKQRDTRGGAEKIFGNRNVTYVCWFVYIFGKIEMLSCRCCVVVGDGGGIYIIL